MTGVGVPSVMTYMSLFNFVLGFDILKGNFFDGSPGQWYYLSADEE